MITITMATVTTAKRSAPNAADAMIIIIDREIIDTGPSN